MLTRTSAKQLPKKPDPKNNNLSIASFSDLFDPRLMNCECVVSGGGFLGSPEAEVGHLEDAIAYAFMSVAKPRKAGMRSEMAHPYSKERKDVEVQR